MFVTLVGAIVASHLGVGGELVRSSSDGSRSSLVGDAATLEKLESQLAAEVQAREELADRIAELAAKFSQLQSAGGEATETSRARSPEDSLEDESGEKQTGAGKTAQFDDQALLARGIHPSDVARLHERWVSHELDTVSIAHRALQEGWFLQRRHTMELTQLDQQLRAELEDEDYDRYLYALGKPNRLRAAEVLPGSPANEAGLRKGDIILRYNDRRVFKPGDLLVASAQIDLGETVPVDILRADGNRATIYFRPGPLGVLLDRQNGEPLRD